MLFVKDKQHLVLVSKTQCFTQELQRLKINYTLRTLIKFKYNIRWRIENCV